MSTPLSLPADVLSWVEEVTGQPVVQADRIPGGGVREGWFIEVGSSRDDCRPLFLRYSPAPLPASSAFHRLATEASVVRALHGAGIAVAEIYAVHPTREAVLMERVPGKTWFSQIRDADEQVSVAQDFIRNLAAIHRLQPQQLDLPALGPSVSAREIALARIAEIRDRGTAADGGMDPLVRLSTDWLERNVPDYDGPVVLVQGDTGPGNFMHQDGRVTAVLDWELCHWGDPMDDIAWLSLRTVQDTFTHLPDRLREYEEQSGHALDVDRVWYYRLFAETTMATLNESDDDAETAQKDVGNLLIYQQLHRRLWLQTLAVVMGLDLPEPKLPAPPDPPDWHPLYDDVLGMLKVIVPRVQDPLAAQWTKGAARLVRYLQELDVAGRQYADAELADMAALLGHRPASVEEGRSALAEANGAGAVTDEQYVRYMWDRTFRDDHLKRTASGALGRRTWPPLV